MPVQYTGIRDEHLAVRQRAGVFDVSHMGEIETCGPSAEAFLQRLLSNDVAGVPEGGAQYTVICLEDGGIIDDLFTYRLAGDHFLTVTNASNHDKDLAWFRRQAEGFDVAAARPPGDFAMLAVQGPERAGSSRAGRRAPAGRFRLLPAPSPACPAAGLRHGLHGRGRRRAADLPEDARQPCGTRCSRRRRAGRPRRARHAAPGGQLPPLRQRHGRARDPIEAGLGWAARRRPASSAPRLFPRCARPGPTEKLVAFAITGPGIARQGNPIAGGGVVTSRDHVAVPRASGSGWPTCRPSRRARHRRIEIDVRGKTPHGRSPQQAALHQGDAEPWPTRVSRRPEVPPRARLGAHRRRRRHVRHHLVRPGLAGRGRVLRPARDRHDGHARTSPTPRSSPSRRSPT